MTDPKYTGPNHLGPSHSSPYPTQRLSSAISLVDTAKQIEAASAAVAHQTSSQLRLIAEQIQHLQNQAQSILQKAKADLALHQAECNLRKIPGKTYHLYERTPGHSYFSLLSPADHQNQPPHAFLGSFRLEADQTWTPLEQDGQHRARSRAAERLAEAVLAPESTPPSRD